MILTRVPRTATLVALLVMCALEFSGTLHSVIPHTHGHIDVGHRHEERKESASWTSLHFALRHEDKKLLDVVIAMLWGMVVVVGFVAAIAATPTFFKQRLPHLHDPLRGEFLRRGIARYRRFG